MLVKEPTQFDASTRRIEYIPFLPDLDQYVVKNEMVAVDERQIRGRGGEMFEAVIAEAWHRIPPLPSYVHWALLRRVPGAPLRSFFLSSRPPSCQDEVIYRL